MKKSFRVLLIIAVILASYMLIYTSSKLTYFVGHYSSIPVVTQNETQYCWTNILSSDCTWGVASPGFGWINTGAARQIIVYTYETYHP